MKAKMRAFMCSFAEVTLDGERGRVQAVTGLCWSSTHSLMSSAMDDTLKRWDATTGSAVDTIHTGKALLCCASGASEGGSGGGGALVATGAADGTLRWWDCRAGAQQQEALVWHQSCFTCAS
jgi:WD40 repeat protein